MRNEYAIDLTCHGPMNVMRGRGPGLFQVRVIHKAFCRIDEMPLHILLEEVHEVSKSLSAPIVVDLYPTAAVGLTSLLQVRVTSQNAPRLLVSKKCDLADSNGSDLTSIE